VGGVLLLAPRTTLLGALVCLVDLVQVFLLNMTFDIGVKLISLHLVLMSILLIAPDLRRVAGVLVYARPSGSPSGGTATHTPRSRPRRLFESPRRQCLETMGNGR